MSSEGRGNAMRAQLRSSWTATRIEWPRRRFSPPAPSGDPASPAAWLSFEDVVADANPITFGGSYEVLGDVVLGVHVERGAGEDYARQLADDAAGVFRGQVLSMADGSLTFLEPTVRPAEGDDDSAWLSFEVSCPYIGLEEPA